MFDFILKLCLLMVTGGNVALVMKIFLPLGRSAPSPHRDGFHLGGLASGFR